MVRFLRWPCFPPLIGLWLGDSKGTPNDPQEEKQVDQLLELVSSLANLTQNQANLLAELGRQNSELLAQLEAVQAIAKAKA